MTADDVAILRLGYRPDDRPTLPRGCSPPHNWKAQLCSRLWMRGEPDMFGVIGTIHRLLNPKAIRPAAMTGRVFTN